MGTNIKVFIADDHRILIDGLVAVLNTRPESSRGIEIIGQASNGQEVLNKLRAMPKSSVDVLVLDINMPIMDGISVAEIVREEFPSIKIMFLTGLDDRRHFDDATKLNANGYVSKSRSGEQVLENIYKVYRSAVGSLLIDVDTLQAKSPIPNLKDVLTERELEIALLVADGKTTAQIAEQLFISEYTVSTHRKHLMQKLKVSHGVESHTDLVKLFNKT